MPPSANDLSEEEVTLIEQWISEMAGLELSCDISFLNSPSTGTNNTIAIQSTVETDLQVGDQIGVFYFNEDGQYVCSSSITWTGETDALTGFGDDSFTTEIDGFSSGGEMLFLALSEDGTIHQLSVTLDSNSPFSTVWVNNGFASVLSMTIINSLECGDELEGCTDPLACNYNPNATEDDGSCTYLDGVCETCENGIIIDNDIDNDGVCDNDEVIGLSLIHI